MVPQRLTHLSHWQNGNNIADDNIKCNFANENWLVSIIKVTWGNQGTYCFGLSSATGVMETLFNFPWKLLKLCSSNLINISAWENLLAAILVTLGRGHTASKVVKILAYLHDKVRNQLYCSNGRVNWHGMKGSCVDRMLDPPCGLELWPHVWSWHLSFRYSCSNFKIQCLYFRKGWCEMKGLWIQNII